MNFDLAGLNSEQFLLLGGHEVAYIRQRRTDDGQDAYVVHAADGGVLSVVPDYATALAAVEHFKLLPATVH